MGVFAVDFREKPRNWWGLLVSNRASFEGRRDGREGQGAGVVQVGVDEGGNVGNGDVWSSTVWLKFDGTATIGCPIFGAVLSRLRWAIVQSTILPGQT